MLNEIILIFLAIKRVYPATFWLSINISSLGHLAAWVSIPSPNFSFRPEVVELHLPKRIYSLRYFLAASFPVSRS